MVFPWKGVPERYEEKQGIPGSITLVRGFFISGSKVFFEKEKNHVE